MPGGELRCIKAVSNVTLRRVGCGRSEAEEVALEHAHSSCAVEGKQAASRGMLEPCLQGAETAARRVPELRPVRGSTGR